MKRFEKASLLAGGEFFDRVDYTWQAWLPARQIIKDALAGRKSGEGADASGRLLIFDEYAAWKVCDRRMEGDALADSSPTRGTQSHLFDLEADLAIPDNELVLYVVYPDESGKWRVQCVPESADSFISRKPLPEPWRGVRDQELSELSGIPDCLFVHASGFIGGNGTRQGALDMAHAALRFGS